VANTEYVLFNGKMYLSKLIGSRFELNSLKLLFGPILSISIFTGYLSFVTQIVYYFYFSALLIIFYLAIVFLSRARRENGRFFRFIKGDFCLKGDVGAEELLKPEDFTNY
jgi:hypothetical protein